MSAPLPPGHGRPASAQDGGRDERAWHPGDPCPRCGAHNDPVYGVQLCTTASGRDHKARWAGPVSHRRAAAAADQPGATDQGPSAADSGGGTRPGARDGDAPTTVADHRSERTAPAQPGAGGEADERHGHIHLRSRGACPLCGEEENHEHAPDSDGAGGEAWDPPYMLANTLEEFDRAMAASKRIHPDLAPSAGQDTERLRDELARVIGAHLPVYSGPDSIGCSAGCVAEWEPDHVTRALLDGPLRQLIAERDEARAQVQRVREVVRFWDLAETPAVVMETDIRRALGQP